MNVVGDKEVDVTVIVLVHVKVIGKGMIDVVVIVGVIAVEDKKEVTVMVEIVQEIEIMEEIEEIREEADQREDVM